VLGKCIACFVVRRFFLYLDVIQCRAFGTRVCKPGEDSLNLLALVLLVCHLVQG